MIKETKLWVDEPICDNAEYRIEELQAENEKLKNSEIAMNFNLVRRQELEKRWQDLKDWIDDEEYNQRCRDIWPMEIRDKMKELESGK